CFARRRLRQRIERAGPAMERRLLVPIKRAAVETVGVIAELRDTIVRETVAGERFLPIARLGESLRFPFLASLGLAPLGRGHSINARSRIASRQHHQD